MAKQKSTSARIGLITTKKFLAILREFDIDIKNIENGFKLTNSKTKQTSTIHSHNMKHELNPSVIKKTVAWLGISIEAFNAKA